ncbi:MAG: hypothetical protein R2712_17310 [Vicinamibacterales bacterium]
MDDLLDRAGRYVTEYEDAFWLLAMDEDYVQWLERPTNRVPTCRAPIPGAACCRASSSASVS